MLDIRVGSICPSRVRCLDKLHHDPAVAALINPTPHPRQASCLGRQLRGEEHRSMTAITDALHRCRQSPADPVPDQEGTESELAILRAPTHANRIDISRAESAGRMCGLKLISYKLFVTVCYRHLPPPKRKQIATSRSPFLNPARSCRARSIAGTKISGAMQGSSPWRGGGIARHHRRPGQPTPGRLTALRALRPGRPARPRTNGGPSRRGTRRPASRPRRRGHG